MSRYLLLLAFSLLPSVANTRAAAGRAPLDVFTNFELTAQQIAAIDAGRPIAKVLSWGGPSEVYVFGAVHLDGSPEIYLEPGKSAVVAQIYEEQTAPVNQRMAALGGLVFRRELTDAADENYQKQVAVIKRRLQGRHHV